ncbi:aminotransferase class III-fold pyridoxal phosphate-dependent enzyme [Candidatus Halocynthiibacter alkanivorans]|uniref:aminotransferase class III-fold pyridoxal phosphate-dependent enzyme n=1 Tax=Candidatus Halocynthiibacter alkanivorans TaxID=2267619 RepID=UPI00190FB6A4|nr:aminotransferase class III-fold pyridoxal phosphate-dependent enzyme [Candidatus Halocynthiibacter alkanivorans]
MTMIPHWQNAVKDTWAQQVTLSRIDGEYDLNFLATGTGEADGLYVLKVMRAGCSEALVQQQCAALDHLRRTTPGLPVPAVIPTRNAALFATLPDETGTPRLVWLQQRLPGVSWAEFSPHSLDLIQQLGAHTGRMDAAMAGMDTPALLPEDAVSAAPDFKWDLRAALWIEDQSVVITDPGRGAVLADIINKFKSIRPALEALPRQLIHNDVNDYNILVTASRTEKPHVSGLIDFGDMCRAPRICNLAIAAAYVLMDHAAPEAALVALVQGYHSENPLTAAETGLIWPLLRMRLAVSVVNSTLMAAKNPDDPYITISQAPAWRLLESDSVNAALIPARLRAACGLPINDAAPRIKSWLDKNRGQFAPLMGQDLSDTPTGSLSVEHSTWPQNPFDMGATEAARVGEEFGDFWLGHYNEPRLTYTADAFRNGPHKASERRTVHIAVDVFAPAGTPLHAPLEATVHVVENRDAHLDYGGVIILRHETSAGDNFFTLYGHLDPEICARLSPGDPIAKGTAFARLGDASQNGGWAPHVHFQLALSLDGMGEDWPGVASPDEMYLWQALCPNPAALLNLPDRKTAFEPLQKELVHQDRKRCFGDNVKLSYQDPVMLMRGWQHHLFDQWGRPYLDAYNNVPHVGHAHPRIQAVAADQLRRMNSNTRYLHPAQSAFADKLISKMPDELSVCYLVNSGSEANELALRLARAHSGGKDMVTPDHGYHGNTTGAIDLSAYKFNAPGGIGQPDWVQLVEVADDYRGSFRRGDPDRAAKFADLVQSAIRNIDTRGGRLAGFIAETFPSVGGQIIPPAGYLARVYTHIRAAGGICIADEVQTGLGRLGDWYFGFEQQGVTPDIVVLGKPIGNGHPIGVVITRPDIAASFARGPEFFSTFGGSTLSCRIGKEVLDIVDDEGLQENARHRGDQLLAGLRDLMGKHALIGDVRGCGLFLGVELVGPEMAPATQAAGYLKNRLREERILIGTEGPWDNILKIRPPLTIDKEDCDMLLSVLDRILGETALTS